MHCYASIARSGDPDKSTVVKRFDWVERMKMDSVYGSIEKESVLILLKHMLATTGDIRFPSEWC